MYRLMNTQQVNTSQANKGSGHMQTSHKLDTLVQKKIKQKNGETFHNKNYMVFELLHALGMLHFISIKCPYS